MLRLTTVGWALLAAPLVAQPGPEQPQASNRTAQGDVSVTIYANDLALVQDVRRLDLPLGRSRQAFADVSAAIRPETVGISAAGASVIEQNFDYDLLSPTSLMQKALGETITLVRTNPGTGAETRERAKVLAVNGGVVLQLGDRIEVLRDDGLPVRAVFDKVPDSLRARPTLSVSLDSQRGGARPVTLSYLSRGLGWNADYVALYDEKAGTIDVQGWVTLRNTSGTGFYNAKTLLVAGEVGSEDENTYRPYQPRPIPRPMRRAGTETAAREQLGDFYLYPLPARTTIADKQTKQVSFLDVKAAPATSGYSYHAQWNRSAEQAESASSVLKFSNAAKRGLGDALPAGIVRVYMRDTRGQPQFVGESRIDHTPQGSDLEVRTGDAFDVKVEPEVVSRTHQPDERHFKTEMRYVLTNAKDRSVTVELVQEGLRWLWDDTRIISESAKSVRSNADSTTWRVSVPANGTATVTAMFETRY